MSSYGIKNHCILLVVDLPQAGSGVKTHPETVNLFFKGQCSARDLLDGVSDMLVNK
jgi:hypothetical protein